MSLDEFLVKKNNKYLYTHAVLMDGKWYERGHMGWFGIVSGADDNWEREFTKLLESIDPEKCIAIIDYHI